MTNDLQCKRSIKKNSSEKKMDGTIPMFVIAMLLIFVGAKVAPAAYGNIPNRYPVLAACTRFEYPIFKSVDWDEYGYPEVTTISDVSLWSDQYHQTVSAVIDEAYKGNSGSPLCTASSYGAMLPLTGSLGQLASALPSWHSLTWQLPSNDADSDDFDPDPELINTNLGSLSQLDVGTVLLEYLRMYECALVERSLFLPLETLGQEQDREERLRELKDETSGDILKRQEKEEEDEIEEEADDILERLEGVLSALIGILKKKSLDWGRYTSFIIGDRQAILQELTIARRSLERSLVFIAAFNRMRPIDMELTCLQQASLDVRNGLALAADASSCLPRIWNNKDILRDYK